MFSSHGCFFVNKKLWNFLNSKNFNRIVFFSLLYRGKWKKKPTRKRAHDVYNAIKIIIRFQNGSVDVTFGFLIESSNFDVRNVLFVRGFFFSTLNSLGKCKLNLLLLHCLHFLTLWPLPNFLYLSLSLSVDRVCAHKRSSCCFRLLGFCMSVRFLCRISVFLFFVVLNFCFVFGCAFLPKPFAIRLFTLLFHLEIYAWLFEVVFVQQWIRIRLWRWLRLQLRFSSCKLHLFQKKNFSKYNVRRHSVAMNHTVDIRVLKSCHCESGCCLFFPSVSLLVGKLHFAVVT